MKKQLRFLYRYLIAAGRWRTWINTQTLLIVVVSAVFLGVLFTSAPRTNDTPPMRPESSGSVVLAESVAQTLPPTDDPSSGSTPTAAPTPTRTPFPPEFYENANQTAGITLAGVALVLIIIVGVWTMRPNRGQD